MGLFTMLRDPAGRALRRHFAADAKNIVISERKFPPRMRADLQLALNALLPLSPAPDAPRTLRFTGLHSPYMQPMSLTALLAGASAVTFAPPQFEDVDIGEAAPVRCLKSGLWFLEQGPVRAALLLSQEEQRYCGAGPLLIEIATTPDHAAFAQQLFAHLEKAVRESRSYRGKVLSFDVASPYTGQSQGLLVHKLRPVSREQVILPRTTLQLLDRNVLGFVERREKIGKFGQSRKKGLLFYGPPGTGKTHTIHYLAAALPRHTTLIISAEQVAMLGEYMTLARLLQPSLVVIEDADLIARNRTHMNNPGEELLLNKLLNEMDGLKEDADVLFILTTNRPEALEEALTARPGRIDQAIEFPPPDAEGREKLIRLYAGNAHLDDALLHSTVARTAGVSPAFIKELMRRAAQFHLESSDDPALTPADLEDALNEILFRGGSLNAKLLGAAPT
jgi:hypothetical protein